MHILKNIEKYVPMPCYGSGADAMQLFLIGQLSTKRVNEMALGVFLFACETRGKVEVMKATWRGTMVNDSLCLSASSVHL